MAAETPLFLLHVIGFAGFLWLALYVAARGQRGSIAALTGLAAGATCLYFLYGRLLEALHNGPADLWLAVDRLGWFCDVLPASTTASTTLTCGG